MTAPGAPGAAGPLGEEARRLVEAARDWAVRTFPEVDAHVATGSPECCWCPLCRAVAALRGGHPEVTEKVADVLTAGARALAVVLDAAARPAVPDPPPSRPPAPRTEPIPLDED